MDTLKSIQQLVKALEAGSYNAAPSTLTQGAALQIEDLQPVMHNVTFQEEHIKLQKMLASDSVKSNLAQFDRQLSYGHFGGSAQLEGNVGPESTSDFVRIVVPMAFYSHVRRVTIVANMVATVDGKKAEERQAADAAMKIAGDIEFDLFRGKEAFSNAGVYDANPLAMPTLPGILGLDCQIRQSDMLRNGMDLMFNEYGSDESVVIQGGGDTTGSAPTTRGGGVLVQENIEDAAVRSTMNMGQADKLIVDPKVLSDYNKIAFGKERIILAGSAQDASGADLRRQWVSGGTVTVEASRFLSGKTSPAPVRPDGPAAPAAIATANVGAQGTAFVAGEVYIYFATTCNERGESPRIVAGAHTINADGDAVTVTLTHPAAGVFRYFNVYRSPAGGTQASAKFIGRVQVRQGQATTILTDLGNRRPGFVTGYLVQGDTMAMKELAPYSRIKLAVTDLSVPEAHFRFVTLAVYQPRKNVLVDNLLGL